MIYYSHHPSPEKRLQSLDRNHRIGQDEDVVVIDIVAHRTVDVKQLERFAAKERTSATVTGEEYKEWISASVYE